MPYEEWEQAIVDEVLAEVSGDDAVSRNVVHRAFVSRSKGIRNGKRRIRKVYKEIHLLSYQGSRYYTWDKFPFDEYATECIGDIEDSERIFMNRVASLAWY